MRIYVSLLFATVLSALNARRDLVLENLARRHQLVVMSRAARRSSLHRTPTPLAPRRCALPYRGRRRGTQLYAENLSMSN
jgi:hypothetical protein